MGGMPGVPYPVVWEACLVYIPGLYTCYTLGIPPLLYTCYTLGIPYLGENDAQSGAFSPKDYERMMRRVVPFLLMFRRE